MDRRSPRRAIVPVSLSDEEYEALERYRDGVNELVSIAMAARILVREGLQGAGLLDKTAKLERRRKR